MDEKASLNQLFQLQVLKNLAKLIYMLHRHVYVMILMQCLTNE